MAKKTIGTLSTRLTVESSAFSRGMRSSRKEIKNFSQEVGGLRKTVGRVGAAIAAIPIVGAIKDLVRSQLDAADSLGKTADKLGIGTKQLAGFHLAAKLTGVEVRTFDMGLQRMVRRVSEAARGTGEARVALQELRLDAKKLAALRVDHQFLFVAKAMGEVSRQGDKVRLAMKLFDSEGVALVNTMGLGGDKLMKLMISAADMGLGLDRGEIGKIEQLNDAFTMTGAALAGSFRRFIVSAGPFVIAFLEELNDALEALSKHVGGAAQEFSGFLGKVMGGIGKVLPDVWGLDFFDNVGNVFKRAEELRKRFEANLSGGNGLFDLDSTMDLIGRAQKLIEKFTPPIAKFRQQVKELREVFMAGLIERGTFSSAMRSLVNDFSSVLGSGAGAVSGVEAGSAEARARIRNAGQASKLETLSQKLVDTAVRDLQIQRNIERILEQQKLVLSFIPGSGI